METITLEVTEGKFDTAKAARGAGRIPVNYYGKGVDNRFFSIAYQEFRRAYSKGGRSTIMNLVNDKKEAFTVLVHDIQYDPITDDMIHIDMKAIEMGKPITAYIPLTFVGTSPAVKDDGGVLVTSKDSLEVECLPKDLVHDIQVDISPLVDFHSSITVGDIRLPDGITVLDAADINVVTVSAPRAAIEEEAAPAASGEAAPAVGGEAGGGEEAKEE